MTRLVTVYNRRTGKKLGLRPESWLRLYPHLSETPLAKAKRSPKKKITPATPAAEPSSEATDTAPEEENTNGRP